MPAYISILNLTISELWLIEKERKIDGYKNMFKKQLDDWFTKLQRLKIPLLMPRSKTSIPLLGPYLYQELKDLYIYRE